MEFMELKLSEYSILFPLKFFPGVPIFFFVSGFLISKSYENNSIIKEYTRNRLLRIYPALIICTFISLFSIYLTGYFSTKDINPLEFLFWVAGQTSIVQFYNPEFMRQFGNGVLNGSLWTITVELQFYIIVPMIYLLLRLEKNSNFKLLFLMIIFLVTNIIYRNSFIDYNEIFIYKLIGVSFIPWIYMFLLGVFFQKNFTFFYKYLSEKFVYLLPPYLLVGYIAIKFFKFPLGNFIHPFLYFSLAVVIFSFAYSYTSFSKKALNGVDISYGLYIYHVPVMNIFLHYGYVNNINYVILSVLISIFFAMFSWFCIEQKCLNFKKKSIKSQTID